MSESWHAAVAATRVKRKPLFWVETTMGTTVDVCTSLTEARKYIANAASPQLYRVFRQDGGALYMVELRIT